MSTFERVKELCRKHGISVVELEERLDFSRNSLYSWKKNNPSVDKLEKVADYFNVSTDYLLLRTDYPSPAISSFNDTEVTLATSSENNNSQLIAAHIDDGVTDAELKDILKYINFIKSKHE